MTAPSFHRVNYSIRTHKNIERKLIFDMFRTLDRRLPLVSHRYVGLGSIWFSDFVLAHRVLSITDLISIEREEVDAVRAAFNKPYRIVEVVAGDSTSVLPRLEVQSSRSITWLDYDTGYSGPAWEDTAFLCARLPSTSIVLVTMNAMPPRGNFEARRRLLGERVGSLLEPEIPSSYFDGVPDEFPNSLAQMMFRNMHRAMRMSGRPEHLVPLFNFYYSDQAPMITVGAIVVDDAAREVVREWMTAVPIECRGGTAQYILEVPHLTPKEKLALDQMLPSTPPPTADSVRASGLPLSDAHIGAYAKHYREYPVFGEIVP